jgi:outer membrane protein
MKSIMRLFLFSLLIAGFAGLNAAKAQAQRIAHLHADSIMVKMDEYKIAELKVDSARKRYEKDISEMKNEYDRKLDEYQNSIKGDSVSELRKQYMQRDLMNMQQNLEDYTNKAQQDMQDYAIKVLEPVRKKIKDAIAAVAKEKGYSYVLDDNVNSGSNILYATDADNIGQLVKAKLNIK